MLSNVQLRQVVATTEQGHYDVRPPCNPASPNGMGRDNAYKMDSLTGLAYGVAAYPDGLPGVFARGVENLQLHNITIVHPQPLPAGWHTATVQILPRSGAIYRAVFYDNDAAMAAPNSSVEALPPRSRVRLFPAASVRSIASSTAAPASAKLRCSSIIAPHQI